MDSTHDLNHWKWYFFTIYVRDKSGQWFPGGHFFTTEQSANVIAEGLTKLKDFVKEQCKERPRYCVIDQSSAEERALNIAFPGMNTSNHIHRS